MSTQSHKHQVLLLYMPVLHDGYQQFFAQFPTATHIYLISEEISHQFKHLVRDVRAVSTHTMQGVLRTLFPEKEIVIAGATELRALGNSLTPIATPFEEISRSVVTEFLPENEVQFASIFLRWDRERAVKEVPPSPTDTITLPQFADKFMNLAFSQSARSSDWWRQVGAVAAKSGKALIATYNTHLPSEQQQYINGDPRALFSSGVQIELTSSIHAEARLISEAARRGISLEGCDFYSSTFPCPPCAKLIATCGATKLFFSEGYSMLDGESVLKESGVEIIQLTATEET